jgi:hypothetical protein
MRSSLIAALVLLSGLSCSDMLLYRASQDYFPLVDGSRWSYQAGAFTSTDSVAGDSAVADRSCIVVLRNFAPEFWVKSPTEVRRLMRRTVILGGQEQVLEERYALEYSLPLVEGAAWSEAFRDTLVLLGTDTVLVRDSLICRVTGIEDVSTPAGTFAQCYSIDVRREMHDVADSVAQYTEWLAPGVGVVRRVFGTDSMVLTGYQVGR